MSAGQAELTKTGKLKRKYLPAIYFDTSIAIDYSLVADDDDFIWSSEMKESPERKVYDAIRIVTGFDKKIQKMTVLRTSLIDKFYDGTLRATPIVSPLVLLEYMKWYAETGFISFAQMAAGSTSFKRMGDKQRGEALKRLMQMRTEEVEKQKAKHTNRIVSDQEPLGTVMSGIWPKESYIKSHSFEGLYYVDMSNFTFSVADAWQEPSAFAVLQIGASDILHIMLAKHLGCKYIASSDSDFSRASEIIKDATGLVVLRSVEEILSLI